MKPRITVIDYGVGNLFSVERALDYCGADVHIASTAQAILEADRLLLPGVGAFSNGMEELLVRGFDQPIREFANSRKPFLGICLGMQMMFNESEEFGNCPGLGLIAGSVRAIPLTNQLGEKHKVPHIGWGELHSGAGGWNDLSLMKGLPPGCTAYFVHSYTAFPDDETVRVADTDYDGCRISAVIQSGNLHGCQFHPERSGEIGLQILRNYLALPVRC